jgi:hypothetical protein
MKTTTNERMGNVERNAKTGAFSAALLVAGLALLPACGKQTEVRPLAPSIKAYKDAFDRDLASRMTYPKSSWGSECTVTSIGAGNVQQAVLWKGKCEVSGGESLGTIEVHANDIEYARYYVGGITNKGVSIVIEFDDFALNRRMENLTSIDFGKATVLRYVLDGNEPYRGVVKMALKAEKGQIPGTAILTMEPSAKKAD